MSRKAWNGILLFLWSVLMLFIGAWITSPKGPQMDSMCSHFPLCPDPLVYLRNMERQPRGLPGPSEIHVVAGREGEITLQFDLSGLPANTPVSVVEVSRRWLNEPGWEHSLSYRPLGFEREAVLYWDPDITLTSKKVGLKNGKLTLKVKARPDARPGLTVMGVQVQKAGTRWGSWGSASFRLRVHSPQTASP